MTPPVQSTPSTLYLIPNTLDLGCAPEALDKVIPSEVIAQAAQLRHWIVEDAKTARAFLKRVHEVHPPGVPIQSMDIRVMPRPMKGGSPPTIRPASGDSLWLSLLEPMAHGHDMGLLSEAGLPAVADPGAELVWAAHRLGVRVVPMSGPNSMMLALAASGLQGQSFAFVGYLPQEAGARTARLRDLQARSRREGQTQLLIETPYRNTAVLQALVEHLDPGTRLSVAIGLTMPRGWCRTATVAEWRQSLPVLDKGLPAVFAFLA